MYVVRNPATKEIIAIRLCEDDANEIRSAREDWEELEVVWEDTEADVLLERLAKIGGRRTELRDSNGLSYCFQLNSMNEIERIFVACVDIEVKTIRRNYWNDTIVINESIDIRVNTMELVY